MCQDLDLMKMTKTKHVVCFKVRKIHGLKQIKLSEIMNKTDKFFERQKEEKKSDFVTFTETWTENCDGELFI